WRVLSGTSNFWWDTWSGLGALHRQVDGCSGYWTDGVGDMYRSDFMIDHDALPPDLLRQLRLEPPSLDSDHVDIPVWTPSTDGKFTLASAKELLRPRRNDELEDIELKRCWQKHLPYKMSFLAWRVLERRLPTDDVLARFGFALPSRCLCCSPPGRETITHIFYHGSMARRVWTYFTESARIWGTHHSSRSALNIWWAQRPRSRMLSFLFHRLPMIILWWEPVERGGMDVLLRCIQWCISQSFLRIHVESHHSELACFFREGTPWYFHDVYARLRFLCSIATVQWFHCDVRANAPTTELALWAVDSTEGTREFTNLQDLDIRVETSSWAVALALGFGLHGWAAHLGGLDRLHLGWSLMTGQPGAGLGLIWTGAGHGAWTGQRLLGWLGRDWASIRDWAYRVFNKRTLTIEESPHIVFSEDNPRLARKDICDDLADSLEKIHVDDDEENTGIYTNTQPQTEEIPQEANQGDEERQEEEEEQAEHEEEEEATELPIAWRTNKNHPLGQGRFEVKNSGNQGEPAMVATLPSMGVFDHRWEGSLVFPFAFQCRPSQDGAGRSRARAPARAPAPAPAPARASLQSIADTLNRLTLTVDGMGQSIERMDWTLQRQHHDMMAFFRGINYVPPPFDSTILGQNYEGEDEEDDSYAPSSSPDEADFEDAVDGDPMDAEDDEEDNDAEDEDAAA
ncbi:unnamed protein product, partial [Cuscuta campestris]